MALRAAIDRRELAAVEWFDAMADAAIRRSELVVAGTRLAVLEVEFYLSRPDHADPFVHKSPAQLHTNGEWYFHREKAAKIGFTLKGLDLTFGAPGLEAGGMLIRAISKPDGTGYVEGPSRVVDVVLGLAGVDAVLALKQLDPYSDDAFAPNGLLHFADRAASTAEAIHTGRRIGLKGDGPYAEAPYRYRARPHLTKKDRARVAAGRRVPVPARAEPVRLTDTELDEILGL